MDKPNIYVSDARMTLEEQIELGKRISEGDGSAREKLVLSCVPIVKSFTKTPLCQLFSSVDDVFQDGMLGALRAVDKYDYTKNVRFTTFAFLYIHKWIWKGIIAQAPLKIRDKDFFDSTLIQSTITVFEATHQHPPTPEQLSSLTNIPIQKVKLYQARNIKKMVVSLYDSWDEALQLPSEDVCFTVEKVLKESAQKQAIAEALDCLTDEEREIVQRRWMCVGRKATLKQLADDNDVAINTIVKRERSAIKKLLAYFISHDVGFDDLVY